MSFAIAWRLEDFDDSRVISCRHGALLHGISRKHLATYTQVTYISMRAVLIELPAFERHRSRHFGDDGFAALQAAQGGIGVATMKRKLFDEISEGFEALKAQRTGKRTLRTHEVEAKPPVEISAQDLLELRERLRLSRAVFARYLRTNLRTLENWEQGRAKPNAQAALLIQLVRKYPDTVERLARI